MNTANTAVAPEPRVRRRREREWSAPSFVRDLFLGKLRMDLIQIAGDVVLPGKSFAQRLLVDVGAELFAMAAACARAQWLLKQDRARGRGAVDLADLFCRQARGRIHAISRGLRRNADEETYRVAQDVLAGEHRWLERGTVEGL